MPIPDFDGISNVLPPHRGNPALPGDLSPYLCTIEELCDHFAYTPERKAILEGFLNLREKLLELGIQGFQWLDGSFLEDIEVQDSRPPNDIDVVTFIEVPNTDSKIIAALDQNPTLWRIPAVKNTYHVDHYVISLYSSPRLIVDNTRYWYGLFSHRRDQTWKGMLQVELKTEVDEEKARKVLEKKP